MCWGVCLDEEGASETVSIRGPEDMGIGNHCCKSSSLADVIARKWKRKPPREKSTIKAQLLLEHWPSVQLVEVEHRWRPEGLPAVLAVAQHSNEVRIRRPRRIHQASHAILPLP
jgi:hypothetical protein